MGFDTTSSTLYGFVLALLIWSEVQEKAQEEIGPVVGLNRLPTMDDHSKMDYIRCCKKESLWQIPTVVLGVPHASIKDDAYNGYVIPQGATVINNIWQVSQP